MGCFGNRHVKAHAAVRECRRIILEAFGFGEQFAQMLQIVFRGVSRREFRRHPFDRPLRIQDFHLADAGEIELNGESLGELVGASRCNPGAAARAHADIDDAERLQCAERVPRRVAANAEPRGNILFRTKEITRDHAAGEHRFAHVGDDHVGVGRRPAEILFGARPLHRPKNWFRGHFDAL